MTMTIGVTAADIAKTERELRRLCKRGAFAGERERKVKFLKALIWAQRRTMERQDGRI